MTMAFIDGADNTGADDEEEAGSNVAFTYPATGGIDDIDVAHR